MKKKEAMEIIKNYNLKCKPSEFVDFYEKVKVDEQKIREKYKVSKHTFDEKFNWVTIENPANWKYYYVLKWGWKKYLQYTNPFEQWHVPLNDDNIDEVIKEHIDRLVKEEVNKIKLEETIEYFLE